MEKIEKKPEKMKRSILSQRLSQLADLVPPCTRVIDVGSDHGYVPAYLLDHGITQEIIATDINLLPSIRTQTFFKNKGYGEKATVYQCDGLSGIRLIDHDVILISGLGGLTIIGILQAAFKERNASFPDGCIFIMQPQNGHEELRRFLYAYGFLITDEKIIYEDGHFYVAIVAKWTEARRVIASLPELYLGPCILKHRPKYYWDYLEHQKNVLEQRLLGDARLREVLNYVETLLVDRPVERKDDDDDNR